MSNGIKILIFKILVIVGIGFFILMGIGTVYAIIKNLDIDETLSPLMFTFIFIYGPIYMLFLSFGMNFEATKPEKYQLKSCDFNEFKLYLEKQFCEKNYNKCGISNLLEQGLIELYVRTKLLGNIDCISLIRVEQVSNESLILINDTINELLHQYYGSKKLFNSINMIIILCVDRVTPAFQKVMNDNLEQNLHHRKLSVGISFGGKILYIAKQEDDFAMAQYKKMRKEILEIVDGKEYSFIKNKIS